MRKDMSKMKNEKEQNVNETIEKAEFQETELQETELEEVNGAGLQLRNGRPDILPGNGGNGGGPLL